MEFSSRAAELTTGASGSAGREVLQGIPIDDIFPDIDIWEVVTSPNYISGVVHIPGEIEDPLTISKLSEFNKFLVNVRYDFFEGVIQPGYTKYLQQELDLTSAEFLSAKLDFMLNRESANWSNWYRSWYLNNNPGLPSPLEQWNYNVVFFLLICSLALLCLFWRIVVYTHIFRGLYYASYSSPREFVWCLGVVIFLLMIVTAFIGYVPPWGQMSYKNKGSAKQRRKPP